MLDKITKEKFASLSEDDRRKYVQAQFHLEYYRQLIPISSAAEGERLAARVKRVGEEGSYRYDIYPIDCLDKEGGALFEEFDGGFPVPDAEKKSVSAAALACRVNKKGWGTKVVTCAYAVTDDAQEPIRITDVRGLNYGLDEMKERISDLYLYSEQKIKLTKAIEEIQQQHSLYTENVNNLIAQAAQLSQENAEADKQLHQTEAAVEELKKKA
ncbi:MAG: hypothetical protein K2K53_05615, partial [Oscillospiraceae bacterium]|nr:hypothetical protein [Oscillospiraceae bacterium]